MFSISLHNTIIMPKIETQNPNIILTFFLVSTALNQVRPKENTDPKNASVSTFLYSLSPAVSPADPSNHILVP